MKGNEEKEMRSYIQMPTKSWVLFMAGAFIAGRLSKRRPVYKTESGGHTYSIGGDGITIWCGRRSDAEKIYDQIEELYFDYGCIYVPDICDILGLSSTWNEAKMGWDDISGFEVKQKFGGYIVNVPKWKNLDMKGDEDVSESGSDEE